MPPYFYDLLSIAFVFDHFNFYFLFHFLFQFVFELRKKINWCFIVSFQMSLVEVNMLIFEDVQISPFDSSSSLCFRFFFSFIFFLLQFYLYRVSWTWALNCHHWALFIHYKPLIFSETVVFTSKSSKDEEKPFFLKFYQQTKKEIHAQNIHSISHYWISFSHDVLRSTRKCKF